MKGFDFFIVKLILILFIFIIGHSLFIEYDYEVSEDSIENCKFQTHLSSNKILKEINLSIAIEEIEELQDQPVSNSISYQREINVNNNSTIFVSIQEHYQSFILFETDNSPPSYYQS